MFFGAIGDLSIVLRLQREGSTLRGHYLYVKRAFPISLTGTIAATGAFELDELSFAGAKVAKVRGTLSSDFVAIDGTWQQGERSLPLVAKAVPLATYAEATAAWKTDLSGVPMENEVALRLEYDAAGPDGHRYLEFGGAPRGRYVVRDGQRQLVLPWDLGESSNPRLYSVFDSRDSHWYGGALLTVGNKAPRVTIAYVGLSGTGVDALGPLSLEVAMDFKRAAIEAPKSGSMLARLLGRLLPSAQACGPALFISMLGASRLTPFKTANDVRWYEVESPVPLFNLPTEYCDEAMVRALGIGTAHQDDYYADLCARMRGPGSVRVHIDYQPVGPASVDVKVAGLILDREGSEYRQARLAHWTGDSYRVQLVAAERGKVSYELDPQTSVVAMRLTNQGPDVAKLDAMSLDVLTRSIGYGDDVLESLGLADADGRSVARFPVRALGSKLGARVLKPGESTLAPLFTLSALSPEALYFPVARIAHAADEDEPNPAQRGRFIQWEMDPTYDVDSVRGLSGEAYFVRGGRYSFYYVGADRKVETIDAAVEQAPHEGEDIGYRLVVPTQGSFIYDFVPSPEALTLHRAPRPNAADFEWGLVLDEDGATYLRRRPTASVVGKSRDFYGHGITEYRDGERFGFVVERTTYTRFGKPSGRAIAYEMPARWMANKKLAAVLRWMIRSNDIRQHP